MEIETLSVRNLLDKNYDVLPFTGRWHEAFGTPTAYGTWFIYGMSSSGKTSFTMQLVKYLDELGIRIGYLSLEESTGLTFQRAVIRANWREKGSGIRLIKPACVDDVDEWLSDKVRKRPNVLVVDTIQYWGLTFK